MYTLFVIIVGVVVLGGVATVFVSLEYTDHWWRVRRK